MSTDKAKMYRVTGPIDRPNIDDASEIEVQFNPASLKVGLSNSLKQNERDQSTRAAQFIEKSSSNLTVELIFDTSDLYIVPDKTEDGAGGEKNLKDTDVRLLVKKIATTFLFSADVGDENVEPQRCKFIWGAFSFIGIMESLEETLDFFSPEGIPLRATVSLKLSESRFQYSNESVKAAKKDTPSVSNAPATVDSANDQAGGDQDPRSTAMFNGVESPRVPGADSLSVPTAGALGDLKSATGALNAGGSLGAGIGGGIAGGFGAGLGAGFSAGFGGGLSLGIGLDVGLSAGLSGGIGGGLSVGGDLSGGLSGGIGGSLSGGLSAGLSGGVSAKVSAGLNASASITSSSPSFNFGSSASLGTSIPGAFSADFKSPSGLCAGAIVSGGVVMREDSISVSSTSTGLSGSASVSTSNSGLTATAQVGFD